MFPRRKAVSRVLFYTGLLSVTLWMWLSLPDEAHINYTNIKRDKGTLQTAATTLRTVQFGEKTYSTTPKLSHRHSNESLNQIRNNMTILKANDTDLQDIMLRLKDPDGKVYANPHPFKYILNARNMCKGKDVFLMIYVHTAPSHTKRRMVIRNTWANQKYYPDDIVRVIFVMGKTKDKQEIQDSLAFESEQYGDIVQEDFEDTYKNLTYKGIAALKWIKIYCSHSKFVLKTDDDIFVNMFTLMRHLKSLDRYGTQNKNLIMCLVWYRMPVMRTGKWKVSEADFKDKYYPTYCSGSAFTMSTDVAVRMFNVSLYTKFFWVDDFYITGLLPLKLGVKHKQFMSTYVLNGNQLETKFTGPQWFTYIFSHLHDLNRIQKVWDTLVGLASGKVKPTVKFALPGSLPKYPKIPNKG